MTQDYEVVWPLGRRVTRAVELSARVPDLAGRVVGELSLGLYRADDVLHRIRVHLNARYPGVTFVGHSNFGRLHGPDEREVVAALPGRLRQEQVDLVIAAIGA